VTSDHSDGYRNRTRCGALQSGIAPSRFERVVSFDAAAWPRPTDILRRRGDIETVTRILLLLPDDMLFGKCLRSITAGIQNCSCLRADSWEELFDASRLSPPAIVIFDPSVSETPVEAVAAFRRAYPSPALVTYCRQANCSAQTIVELVHVGVSCAFSYAIDDFSTDIVARLGELLRKSESTKITTFLLRGVPPELHQAILYIWENAHLRLSTDDVARLLCCHAKTARERFARAALPSPGRIIGWCRLLKAAQLLQSQRISVAQVARFLGYGSPAALYRLLHLHTGLNPSDLRRRGAIDLLLQSLGSLRSAEC